MKRQHLISISLGLSLCMSTPALAYIGPGAGLGAIGTAIALVGAIVLLIVGFFWYPLKRMIKGRQPKDEQEVPESATQSSESAEKPANPD